MIDRARYTHACISRGNPSTASWLKYLEIFSSVSVVYDYIINTIGRDRKPAQNYRQFAQGINLFDSGNVRKALCRFRNRVCSIKANIRSNQRVTGFYFAQLIFGPSFSASYNCTAGQSCRCSPVCALLMKVVEATNKSITGSMCAHKPCTWNAAMEKNATPGTMEDVYSQAASRRFPCSS